MRHAVESNMKADKGCRLLCSNTGMKTVASKSKETREPVWMRMEIRSGQFLKALAVPKTIWQRCTPY